MRLLNFLVIRLSLFFLLGVYLGLRCSISVSWLFYTIGISLLLLLLFHRLYFKSFRTNYPFALLAYVAFVLLGCLASSIQKPEHQENHLVHHVAEAEQWVQAEITEILKANEYNYKYLAHVNSLDDVPTRGKILLQIPKQLQEEALVEGDVISFYTLLLPFEDPKNPQSFNYKTYMYQQLVMYQAKPKVWLLHDQENTSSLTVKAAKLRNTIQLKLAEAGFNTTQLGLIQALLLGQKKQIDPETYANFSKAGVVHILAVSGLHVGIVLMLLQWVFKPMDYLRNGRTLKSLLVVLLLWGFALVAGFSPSVTRAVTMFSLFAIALNRKRKTNTINLLCLSLFPILVVYPHFILQVGFQLSYAAVFAIVMLQPVLYRLYSPKFWVDKTLWSVTTVTVSAQLGVLPFSLYYFHQFPGLFILANLVIIPFLGILLGGGILVIALALIGGLVEIFVKGYASLLDALLLFVDLIAQKEEFVFQEIYFDFWMFICLFLLMGCLLFFAKTKQYMYAVGMLVTGIGLSWSYALALHDQQNTAEFIIFNEYRNSFFGIKKGQEFTFYTADTLTQPKDWYSLKNYFTMHNIKHHTVEKPSPFYHFNEQETLLRIDSTALYPRSVNQPVVYLSHSPKLNLERLILELQPQQIVADASNYASYIQRWQATCQRYNIPFHTTYRDGAWRREIEVKLDKDFK